MCGALAFVLSKPLFSSAFTSSVSFTRFYRDPGKKFAPLSLHFTILVLHSIGFLDSSPFRSDFGFSALGWFSFWLVLSICLLLLVGLRPHSFFTAPMSVAVAVLFCCCSCGKSSILTRAVF